MRAAKWHIVFIQEKRTRKESGAWLNALPIIIGWSNSLRIAVGLRLGTPLCSPHVCHHCNEQVGILGRHGLSCRQSEGRHYRHATINEIICRSLTSVNVPSLLEPSGLFRSDGKRPDRVTVTPWSSGKPLVWDATCPDTFAWSHRSSAVLVAGKVAAKAEEHNERKYSDLMSSHCHWDHWGFGAHTLPFVKNLGLRLLRQSGDTKSISYLFQCLSLSIAVQQGNAISILGTSPKLLLNYFCCILLCLT